MTRSNTWKLGIISIIIILGYSLITPLEDRALGDYALNQVTSEANASDHQGHETFSEVIQNIRNQLPSEESIDYAALRAYGKRNRFR